MTRLVLVTDPMCAWCWGMTDEFEQARSTLSDRVEFELMLGGINVHGTQPIGDYGRRFLMRLWREVEETTGQTFGYQLPDEYIHNSARSCLALQAARALSGEPPFAYLRALQQAFFERGVDITLAEVLIEIASELGMDGEALARGMDDPARLEEVKFQFEHAQSFGTQAMPSLLIEGADRVLRLFGGGYMDAAAIEAQLDAQQTIGV